MIGVLAAAWAFLSSPAGLTVTSTVASGIWYLVHRKKVTRKRTLQDLAHDAFEVVEKMGLAQALQGEQKWQRFTRVLMAAMQAEGHKKPTQAELRQLYEWAFREAWKRKPPARPPVH